MINISKINRNQIYNYIKTDINPYGKPFEGTVFEFGNKVMDYIKNMTEEDGRIYCYEDMPDNYINVLVFFEPNSCQLPTVAWYSHKNKLWRDSKTEKVINAEVVSWMHLPKDE